MGNGIGLVLEGGAMRGLFTYGVIDVFMENDIRFEAAAGISAGADFCYRELPDVLDPFDRETYGLYRREHLALAEYEAGNGT